MDGNSTLKIALASDHGGFELKNAVVSHLKEKNIAFEDFGSYSPESCDYPDYAAAAAEAVIGGGFTYAILICGTGIGMSISANKIKGIRAALCGDTYSARLTREHNDANALCLGARVVGEGLALDIVDAFLSSEFIGGRHKIRVEKIAALEGDIIQNGG